MADPWEIARHLEEHPDDHEQRWRLAKQLYAAWEYRHALEHLQVLKNEWARHINVNRYLAATLYRLGRYEEAIKELREALRYWPSEVPLHEQLARVLEVSGNKEEAAKVWEKVLELNPDHATAESAARRLREHEAVGASADVSMVDSDGGIPLNRGRICRNCGAQNGEEFERCWQCHAPLGHPGSMPTPTPTMTPAQKPVPREHVNLFAGFVTVGFITLAVYLSLRLLSTAAGASKDMGVLPVTMHGLFTVDLAKTRVGMGVVLLVLWPSLLVLSTRLTRPKRCAPTGWIVLSGVFVATVCYLLTWLAGSMVWLVLPAAALLPLLLMLTSFKLRPTAAVLAWAVHLALLGVLAPLFFGLFEARTLGRFHDPYSATAALLSLAAASETAAPVRRVLLDGESLPAEVEIVWQAMDSSWLTQRAQRVVFIIDYGPAVAKEPPKFEVKDPTGTRVYTEVGIPGSRVVYNVTPETPYTVLLTGATNVRATVETEGLLDVKVVRASGESGAVAP